jgi:hypothetical protein
VCDGDALESVNSEVRTRISISKSLIVPEGGQ